MNSASVKVVMFHASLFVRTRPEMAVKRVCLSVKVVCVKNTSRRCRSEASLTEIADAFPSSSSAGDTKLILILSQHCSCFLTRGFPLSGLDAVT